MSTPERHARHLGLFGAEGQAKISAASVAIVGLGGLGAHVAAQLAYLGVSRFCLIDDDRVEPSNLNRLLGAGPEDLGSAKVDVIGRGLRRIEPAVELCLRDGRFDPEDADGFEGIDVLFGCADNDAVRLELVRATSVRALPYIDLASDVTVAGEFGGRIVFARDGERCLSCLGELDQHALARARMSEEQRQADDAIYGVDRDLLGGGGPSVVSVNGVVASLAVTEFMVWITELREPRGYITYRGDLPMVGSRPDVPRGYCHYCMDLWGSRAGGGTAAGH